MIELSPSSSLQGVLMRQFDQIKLRVTTVVVFKILGFNIFRHPSIHPKVSAVAFTPTYQVSVGGLFFVCSNRYGSSAHAHCLFLLVVIPKH